MSLQTLYRQSFKNLLVIIFAVTLSFQSNAQNLFLNPGFEDLNFCTEYKQFCAPEAWFYLHPVNNPNLYGVNIPVSHSGKELLPVPVSRQMDMQKRQLVYTKFACQLQKGEKYLLGFYINTEPNFFEQIEVHFTTKEPQSNMYPSDTSKPSIILTKQNLVLADKRWSLIEYTYTAKGDERFMLIGNISGTQFKQQLSNGVSGDIYYFLDDVYCKALSNTNCTNFFENKLRIYGHNFRHSEIYELDDPPYRGNIVSDTLIIPAVYFDFDQTIVKQKFVNLLDSLTLALKPKTVLNIQIVGHTDNKGTRAYNKKLSTSRAEIVRKYLSIKMPQHINIIQSTGMDFSQPKATNTTDEGRALNRRVEIIINTVSNVKK